MDLVLYLDSNCMHHGMTRHGTRRPSLPATPPLPDIGSTMTSYDTPRRVLSPVRLTSRLIPPR